MSASMLLIVGQVVNVFEAPKGVSKKTGEAYGGQHRMQIMCQNTLQNGEVRIDLVDLTTDDLEGYRKLLRSTLRIPVGAFATDGVIRYYALKGCAPELVKHAA
jgi:hypothetical protein